MYHYVYQITNLLNNKVYVGKRSSKAHPDVDTYFGSGKRLHIAIKKYGKENFKKEIIAIVDTVDEAEELEEIIVDVEFIARKDTYNLVIGGQKGTRGLVMSEEAKSKLSESQKGRVHSEEAKSKMSSSQKLWKRGPHSNETKEKISKAIKGNKIHEETKSKMSKARKGRVWINNGKISKMVKPDSIHEYTQSGFTFGRL